MSVNMSMSGVPFHLSFGPVCPDSEMLINLNPTAGLFQTQLAKN